MTSPSDPLDAVVASIFEGVECHTQYSDRDRYGAEYHPPIEWVQRDEVEARVYDILDAILNCNGCQADGPKMCATIPALEGYCVRKPR